MWVTRDLTYRAIGLGHYDYGAMPARYAMEGSNDLLSYMTVVFLITLFDHYRASQRAQIRSAQIEQQLAQAQLDNLRLQLQPHFLFNALNTISSVMYENPRAADHMIASLSDLLRASLRNTSSQEIRLDEEVQFVEAYLDIMRGRFEERLKAEVTVDTGVADCLVPPLLLQPLVENAIRYGIEPLSNSVRIQVSASRQNGTLRLQVRDWGPGIPDLARMRTGVGIGHTRSRLEQTYGAQQKFLIENSAGGGVLVRVEIPFHTALDARS
jgi:LytS/YehU family sensor histidine kinase